MNDYIINKPENARWYQRVTSVAIALFFWCAILYLWKPLLVDMISYINAEYLFDKELIKHRQDSFWHALKGYAQVICGLAIIFLLWAKVNQWRFRNKEKRTRSAEVNIDQVASYFDVDKTQLNIWQTYKNTTITILADGNVCSVIDNKQSINSPKESESDQQIA